MTDPQFWREVSLYIMMFAAGVRIGLWVEARRWREKARNGFRQESGGKLYRVMEEK